MSNPITDNPQLVAYCKECGVYLEPEAAGEPCPQCDDGRKLRKRRMWLCDCCEERFAFASRAELESHQKEAVLDD